MSRCPDTAKTSSRGRSFAGWRGFHMFVPDPVSMLLREFGTHTEASWKMAWANLKGQMHPSAMMEEVAAGLDADPTFAGWREQ